MLNSFFIVDKEGTLIFSYQSKKRELDEEKILGLINALSSFGKDAFQEEVQIVRYLTKKLVLKPFKCPKDKVYIGVGVFEIVDNEQLCIKILTYLMSPVVTHCAFDEKTKKELQEKIFEVNTKRTIYKRNLLLVLSIPICLVGNYYSVSLFISSNVWISLLTIILSAFISGFLIGRKSTAVIIILLILPLFIIGTFYLFEWIRYSLNLEDYLMTVLSINLFVAVIGAHLNEHLFLFPRLEELSFLYV